MSTPVEPKPAMLFLSVLSADWPDFPGLTDELTARLGPVEYESEVMEFNFTDYYQKEMGAPLSRRVLGFERLLPMNGLPDVKLFTNSLEQARAGKDGRRAFNLDPGLLTLERLVLATGKNFTHRVYLDKGIWADLTLMFQSGQWQSLPWTFPDYADNRMQSHLTKLRDIYKSKLQNTPKRG